MNETFKLSGMQRTNIELERQRHLANWLVKSSPHMAAAAAVAATTATTPNTASSTTAMASATTNPGLTVGGAGAAAGAGTVGGNGTAAAAGAPSNSVAAAAACNGGAAVGAHHGHHLAAGARKPKLRRFNSHDTSSNMFSVADFENARLARRNEIELNKRLERRLRGSANNSIYGLGGGGAGCGAGSGGGGYSGFCGGLNGSGDYSTGDSKASKGSSESQQEALPADVFLERNPLPRVVRILHADKNSNETLQSSSSHGSSTAASSSSSAGANPVGGGGGNIDTGTGTGTHSSSSGGSGTGTGTGFGPSSGSGSGPGHQINNSRHSSHGGTPPGHDELFLLYRLVRQRNIYHGHNAKTQASQRKKTVLIPQEFPGYFSLLSEKGLATATQYGSLIQLVRERVYKFVSVDNMPAFTESSPSSASSPTHEGCLPIIKGRPQYVKTTARGGQVFRLLAVFEDGKQEQGQNNMSQHGNINVSKSHGSGYMGREKEKNRYAQLLNENRQVMYVPLSTKGKFYEIEPGIPQLLQKLGDAQRKLNPECVHRLGALVTAAKQLPLTLRYISGPGAPDIPDQLCISQVSKEDVVVGCSIEDVDTQTPLQLRKFYPSRDMQLVKSFLGFDSEQRMLANTNVQNMLKFCQFNCDPFLKLVEIELIQRSERSASKNREGLRILKPLHFPKILRREKSTMAAAHEKEDSIIFLSKSDLENLEAKEAAAAVAAQSESSLSRISERMSVFQSTKKKWFGKHHTQQQHHQQQQQQQLVEKQQCELDLDEQAKRMSMERYTDMSKLLQERFGSDPEQPEQDGISLNSTAASDTETTMLTTMEPKSLDTLLQKSMSLQDIELLNGQCKPRPDLLASHNHTDAISEAGTELEDVENQTPPPQSFITEKLYNEFHVKTRQYSKSSSSLHQLRLFALPQKLQLHEAEKEKRHLMLLKAQQQSLAKEPITGRRAAGGVCLLGGGLNHLPISPASLVEDDLPYSSVRDSLVISAGGCLRSEAANRPVPAVDYTKENIYAEICPSHTADTFSGTTQLTHVQDDDGDYASLKYSVNGGPQSVSRIEVNGATTTTAVKSSAISYHTVYLGEEPLGERHAAHITTVELAGEDNIYNTLK
ncbi:uncharacterized protein LOC128263268 isoform X1 [Drosophila gunungcola]|uniref:B4 n=1 Tax=Drosophila gunungcola TaxID=103775 RepID=A0A9Q0BS51_9MUSC|nr:uncharacterized protein LOC128263268 isoform X1 [Drosophila gunungcola]XP_052854162.1 uncharacterized protein LOC128263268 isoform X1 [Drosophila gunungcola]KAI8042607.1 hypothetical protein M5D96_003920 [Drosophila gunungcola]